MSLRRAHLDEITAHRAVGDRLRWHPVRHHLGVASFGTNGYTAVTAGDMVVEPHEEDAFEELYVVLRGAARFTVDGESFDAQAGELVLVTPPSRREAYALEPDTAVLAVGGVPGQAFTPSDWEARWLAETEPAARLRSRAGTPRG